jgi:hypothetical protein
LNYPKIYSNGHTFAALKADGSITAWGYEDTGVPSGNGFELPHAMIEPSALMAAKAVLLA